MHKREKNQTFWNENLNASRMGGFLKSDFAGICLNTYIKLVDLQHISECKSSVKNRSWALHIYVICGGKWKDLERDEHCRKTLGARFHYHLHTCIQFHYICINWDQMLAKELSLWFWLLSWYLLKAQHEIIQTSNFIFFSPFCGTCRMTEVANSLATENNVGCTWSKKSPEYSSEIHTVILISRTVTFIGNGLCAWLQFT